MKSKRATLFLPSLAGGGAERNMVNVATLLTDRGVFVDMLLVQAVGPLLPLVPDGVRVIDLAASRTVASLPALLAYLKDERPDVLLSTLNASVTALAAKRFFAKDMRVVVNYQSTFSEEMTRSPRTQRAMMRALRRLLPTADAVVAASRGAAEDLCACVPGIREKTQKIWNCIDVPKNIYRAPVRHPWFQGSGPPIVLSVARLDAGKDHQTLLRAFSEVRKQRPARLVVLGEGPLRASLESLARRLGIDDSVDFPGFRTNSYGYMARAQVFALASTFEGLSLAIIEALASGAPVVSTDCPHGPAEILEDGKWGRLVQVGDWRSMAKAILAVIESPPAPGPLIERSRSFSLDAVVPCWLAALFPGAAAPCKRAVSGSCS